MSDGAKTEYTRNEANAKCRSFNAGLPSITTMDDLGSVQRLLRPYTFVHNRSLSFWALACDGTSRNLCDTLVIDMANSTNDRIMIDVFATSSIRNALVLCEIGEYPYQTRPLPNRRNNWRKCHVSLIPLRWWRMRSEVHCSWRSR